MFEFTGFFQTNSIIYPHSLRQHVLVGVTCEGHWSGCTYHGGVSLRKIGLYQHQIYTFISSCQLIYRKSFPLINANTMKDKERIYQDCWLLKKHSSLWHWVSQTIQSLFTKSRTMPIVPTHNIFASVRNLFQYWQTCFLLDWSWVSKKSHKFISHSTSQKSHVLIFFFLSLIYTLV